MSAAIAQCAARFTVAPPPGAAKPFKAPPPMACLRCDGTCVEPDEETREIPCSDCQGSGVATRCDHTLPRSRAHERRELIYVPTCCRAGRASGGLVIITAQKESHRPTVASYLIAEFPAESTDGAPCRAFAVAKIGHPDRTHHVEVTAERVTCDCEGSEYLATEWHNEKALAANEEMYPSFGCKHSDALASLLNGGWFDQ